MQRKSTPSLRLKTTARQPGGAADGCSTARVGVSPDHDWQSQIVEDVVREQAGPVYLDRASRSAPRFRRRSWWLDTSPVAQSRRAVKRWHGHTADLWTRNVRISAWCALGSTQAHVGAKYGLTRQRVGQIVREFPWVRTAVKKRLESRAEDLGREGGKCHSSLRGWARSGSLDLESDCVSSGEFWPLSRPERTRWRRICDRRGAGSRRRRKGCGPGGRLAALAADSLASAGGFSSPQQGGKCQFRTGQGRGESASSGPGRAGGKVPVPDLEEIRRRCALRGGEVWRQRAFEFLDPEPPPPLEAPQPYRRQRGLF